MSRNNSQNISKNSYPCSMASPEVSSHLPIRILRQPTLGQKKWWPSGSSISEGLNGKIIELNGGFSVYRRIYRYIMVYSLWIHGHCLRRYLTLQIIVNYTPNTSWEGTWIHRASTRLCVLSHFRGTDDETPLRSIRSEHPMVLKLVLPIH